MKAAAQKPSPDGKRRSRWAIVRNTLVNLRQTVLKDILSLFQGIAEWRPSENTIWIRHADIESEWILMGLDKPDDLRRLLSLQLSGVYINEVREISFPTIFAAFSRCGRFPSAKHGGVECSHRVLIADSNMGVINSELYKFLEQKKHPSVLYVHQPSALSPEADWLSFLPEGYYEDQMIGATRAWIDTHIHAMWSEDLSGEPVFAAAFNEHFHVSSVPLAVLPSLPILVAVDPGLNPAAMFGQLTSRGQLRVLRELHTPNTLFTTFLDSFILPQMQAVGFSMRPHFFILDPAGVNRDANSGLSAKGLMEAKGFDVTLASTNDIDPRIKAIEQFLLEVRQPDTSIAYKSMAELKQDGPMPALLIDPSCEVFIRGLKGEYRFKRKKITQELEDIPEKKHPVSDVMDAGGYLAMGVLGSARFRRKSTQIMTIRAAPQVELDPRAWT